MGSRTESSGGGTATARWTLENRSTMSGRKRTISLNCSLAVPTSSSATSLAGSTTPNTPEILNAIINISSEHLQTFDTPHQTNQPLKCEEITEPVPEYLPINPVPSPSFSDCSERSNSSIPSSLSPPYDSSCCYQQNMGGNFLNPNMSVQRYHSQFIKEGLKMKVKQKIKEEPIGDGGKLEVEDIKKEHEDLTVEDEERRRRRRERNKVAATKCRNKKKERTTLLIAEGEVLEIQNASFKEELIRLEAEKRRLTDILAQHEPTCVKRPRLEKVEDTSKEQKDVFKVPNAPTSKENHQTPSKHQAAPKVEPFDTQRKYPPFSSATNTESRGEAAPFTGEFQYFQYNDGFNHPPGNVFSKQAEQENNQPQQQHGFFNYNFYGANLKTNLLENQALSLSNYGFNGVDSMCVAL